MAMPTLAQIQEKVSSGELTVHHSSMRRGYVPFRGGPIVTPYSGRFGVGYRVDYPNRCKEYYSHSKEYHQIVYYIKKNIWNH